MAKRTNLKVTAVAVLVILVGGSVWADLSEGLIAHWAFDEGVGSTVYDSAGNNDGAIHGAIWTTGQIANALDFDGNNDFISVPASPALDFSRSYTISAWLKPTENPTHAMVWFGYHGGAPYGSNYYRSIHFRIYPSGQIRCGLYGDALNTTAGIVMFGEWNHIVYSYDYDTEISAIYVNSQLIVSGDINPYVGGLRTATIGKWDVPFQSQENFDGLMDEFMVYDRALSAEEIEQLYQLELPELLGIEIVGPDQAAESFPTPYKAIAHYDDDSTKDVTNSADWSVEPEGIASITAGLLTAERINLPGDIITITAQYSEGENVQEAQKDVEILPICPSGSALQFDGVDDYVDCGNDESLDVGGKSFTVMAWVKTTDIHSCSVSKHNGGHDGEWFHGLRGGRFTFGGSQAGKYRDSDTIVNDGDWHHLAGVVAHYGINDNDLHQYIDGQIDGSLQGIADILSGQRHLLIGDENNRLCRFGGLIDEVAIYNKALTAEEIQMLMHTRPDTSDPSLVGYWDFDEGRGIIAHDSSMYGNHGELSSTTYCDPTDVECHAEFYPQWIDSDAPVGICTPKGIVGRNLSGIMNQKLSILEQLYEVMAQEESLLDYMNEMCRNRECGNTRKRDVLKAKQKIHSAIRLEDVAEILIDRSLDKLEDAMNTLGLETDSQE